MRRLLLIALLLTGCSSTPVIVQRTAETDTPFAFNGRIAIIQPTRRDSANLRWTHQQGGDEILLLAPLGQVVARISADRLGVTLQTDGKTYSATDAGELTQQLLGWQLPLAGLRYWVAALPAPDGEYQTEPDADGRIAVLHQQGWTIRYTRYASTGRAALPLRLNLQREGMEVRLLIDEWEAR